MPIFKQPNGKWRAIVQVDKKRRSAVRGTLREAKRAEAMLMIELGKEPDQAGATLEDLIDLHLAGKQRSETTAEDYRYLLAKLPQWLKEWKVENVTPLMLEQAYQRLSRETWKVDGEPVGPMSAHRIRRLHGIIRPAFDAAVRYGWLNYSPAVSLRPPPLPESSVEAPAPEDVVRVLAAADIKLPDFGCALRVAATTGLRRGELCGLQWQDFDADTRQLIIRRSVSTTTANPHAINDGKTGRKGWRVIALSTTTVDALTAHKARQAAFMLKHGIGKSDWVFTHDGRKPWRTDYVTLTFSRLRNEVGADIHLHQLRHHVATTLISSGVDLKTVAGRLGHSRVGTTSDIYAAFMPARDREAADIMDRSLGG